MHENIKTVGIWYPCICRCYVYTVQLTWITAFAHNLWFGDMRLKHWKIKMKLKETKKQCFLTVFGPTACVKATVKFTVLVFKPSSFNSQSRWTMSVVLRLLWKSTKNLDFENKRDINVSTLIGRMVWTNCRPSCMELHSAVLINGIFFPFSESLESDMSVGTWCSDIGGIIFRGVLLSVLRWFTMVFSYFWFSFAVRTSIFDTTLSDCGSEWS